MTLTLIHPVLYITFDFAGDIAESFQSPEIVHLFRLDDNPYFAPSLNSKGFINSIKAQQYFQLFHALDIAFSREGDGAWPSGRNCVRGRTMIASTDLGSISSWWAPMALTICSLMPYLRQCPWKCGGAPLNISVIYFTNIMKNGGLQISTFAPIRSKGTGHMAHL